MRYPMGAPSSDLGELFLIVPPYFVIASGPEWYDLKRFGGTDLC